ncbi:hypothetical protein J5N97_000302 [Dioscorea zingiberensis]|uniref:Uncharacterized protein n=1 Tax=Dioscorea zingiberensis TaxID=325984 RepID=A0A9D5BSL1_9LILI|nr:hypothetical protein J5N97_000302 [Dioscorea zingiberensis]
MGLEDEPLCTSAQEPTRSNVVGYEHQTWLPIIGMVFLTVNSIVAVYRSINDPWMVMFIVTAYANVVLLVYYMRNIEKMPEMKRPVRMKATVWTLASTLTVLFTYRVSIMLPLFLAIIVWLTACVIVLGGFYALLVHREEPDLSNKGSDKVERMDYKCFNELVHITTTPAEADKWVYKKSHCPRQRKSQLVATSPVTSTKHGCRPSTPEMKRPVRMKATVWTLASTLTVLFTYRVSIMLPVFLAIIVWLMACVIVFGGFYSLLVHREEPDLCNKGADKV